MHRAGTISRALPRRPSGSELRVGRRGAGGLGRSPRSVVSRVNCPSGAMRTESSAPTRLRLSARGRSGQQARAGQADLRARRAGHDRAVGSRTTMSRMRTAVRPCSSRSRTVPPTSTLWRLPKFCLDRRRDPRRRKVERDRAAGESPPQEGAKPNDQHAHDRAADERQAAHARPLGRHPAPKRRQPRTRRIRPAWAGGAGSGSGAVCGIGSAARAWSARAVAAR